MRTIKRPSFVVIASLMISLAGHAAILTAPLSYTSEPSSHQRAYSWVRPSDRPMVVSVATVSPKLAEPKIIEEIKPPETKEVLLKKEPIVAASEPVKIALEPATKTVPKKRAF